jgi:hypothetical protein
MLLQTSRYSVDCGYLNEKQGSILLSYTNSQKDTKPLHTKYRYLNG